MNVVGLRNVESFYTSAHIILYQHCRLPSAKIAFVKCLVLRAVDFFLFFFSHQNISSSVFSAILIQFNKKFHHLLSESMATRQKVRRHFWHVGIDYSIATDAISACNCQFLFFNFYLRRNFISIIKKQSYFGVT